MHRMHVTSSLLARTIPKRFSLRGLLVLMLAIGIGLWWWRLPFEVEVDQTECPVMIPQGIGVGNIAAREVQTFRRSWPGHTVRDGLTTIYDYDGQKIAEEMWQNDVRHGSCRYYDTQGYLYATGQYRNGNRYGTWVSQTEVPLRIGLTPAYYEIEVNPQAPRMIVEYVEDKRVRVFATPAPPDPSPHATVAANSTERRVPYAVKWRRKFEGGPDGKSVEPELPTSNSQTKPAVIR